MNRESITLPFESSLSSVTLTSVLPSHHWLDVYGRIVSKPKKVSGVEIPLMGFARVPGGTATASLLNSYEKKGAEEAIT